MPRHAWTLHATRGRKHTHGAIDASFQNVKNLIKHKFRRIPCVKSNQTTEMDFEIVKLILKNSGEDVSKIDLEGCKVNIEDDKIDSRNQELTSALSKSLANFLCHKVSPAAHQRYLVRTNMIEQIRDWSRITNRYSHLHTFTDGERTTQFAMTLVKKYLTEDFIAKQSAVNILVKLGLALIDMRKRNPTFDYKLDIIVNRILCLDRTADGDLFLDTVIEGHESLSLDLATIENLYISRVENLIEIPIVEFFISFNDSPSFQTVERYVASSAKLGARSVSRLLRYSSQSARIFQLLSSVMKEMLSRTECFETVLSFVGFIIKYISDICEDERNGLLDLYPRNLQCAVILLRIDPELHTPNSKDYILRILKGLYASNKQQLLILLTHFPQWLEIFTKFMAEGHDLILR